jgi:hypothetical protein
MARDPTDTATRDLFGTNFADLNPNAEGEAIEAIDACTPILLQSSKVAGREGNLGLNAQEPIC